MVECNDDLIDYYTKRRCLKSKRLCPKNPKRICVNTLDATLKRLTECERELHHCQDRLNFVHNHPLIRPFISCRRMIQNMFGKSHRQP